MFENLYEDLQQELDLIESGAPPAIPDWRKTSIGNWDGGMAAEAARIQNPRWFDRPSNEAEASLNALLQKAGLGKLKDDKNDENKQFHAKGAERGATGESVAAAQREKEKTKLQDEAAYMPNETESITEWFARLGKAIDFNGRKKFLWDALRSYASRFRGDATAKKNLDVKLVQQFLKNVGGENE